MPWSAEPFQFSSSESFQLLRLADYRDDFEHPKQLTYLLTNREVVWAIKATVPIVVRTLCEISHHLNEKLEHLDTLAADIAQLCDEILESELQTNSENTISHSPTPNF